MQTGAHTEAREISDGPRPSDLNCSSALLMLFSSDQQTSSYTETIQALSAAGASEDTTTTQLTQFSRASTSQPASSENSEKENIQHLLLEPSTSYAPSSKKPSTPELRPSSRTNSFSTSSRTIDSFPSRLDSPLPSPNLGPPKLTTEQRPRPYAPNLRPLPSPNRPHCLAKDRLRLWLPVSPSIRATHSSSPNVVPETALNRILEVIGASWADSTNRRIIRYRCTNLPCTS